MFPAIRGSISSSPGQHMVHRDLVSSFLMKITTLDGWGRFKTLRAWIGKSAKTAKISKFPERDLELFPVALVMVNDH